jgi:protein transport protein SEC9
LANTEQHLLVAKGHSARAEDKTSELKQLNRSIFRPVITFNKDAKRAAQEAKVLNRFEEERAAREKTMMDIRETQNRLGRAAAFGEEDENEDEGIQRTKVADKLAARKDQRKRYQFEETASDDELEDELDDNLDGLAKATKSLKSIGLAMGQELDEQNTRLRRIEDQTVALDSRIFRNTERVCCLNVLVIDRGSFQSPAQKNQVMIEMLVG